MQQMGWKRGLALVAQRCSHRRSAGGQRFGSRGAAGLRTQGGADLPNAARADDLARQRLGAGMNWADVCAEVQSDLASLGRQARHRSPRRGVRVDVRFTSG